MHFRALRQGTLVFCLLLAAACDTSKEAPKEEPSQPTQTKGTKKASPEKPAESVKLPDSLVEAFIGEWVKAQNGGSYTKYEKLYASKFYGVKLSKSRKRKFNRASWLEDRKSMFKRPFTVKVKDIQANSTERSSSVTFEQTWASNTYSDTGTKRLFLVNEGSTEKPELRIAQEEMLSSEDPNAEPLQSVPSPLQFSQVRTSANGPAIILKRGFDMNRVSGPLKEFDSDGVRYNVHRPLLDKGIDGVDGDIVGRSFTLYGKEGKLCEATVVRLAARASMTPHFDQVAQMQGMPPYTHEMTALAIANIVWGQARAHGYFTAAELKLSDSCQGALWARDSTLPPPTIYQLGDGSDAKERLKAARASRPGELLMRQEEQDEGQGRGENIQSIQHPKSGVRFLHYVAHSTSCDDPLGSYWDLFQDREDLPVAVTQTDAPVAGGHGFAPFILDAAFDLENDGKPELLTDSELFRWSENGYYSMRDISSPYFDCSC